MRERLARFMQGRNGSDDLSRVETYVALVPLILGLFLHKWMIPYYICEVLFWVIFGHSIFRMLSKNLAKRYEENQKYLNFRYDLVVKQNKAKKRAQQRKDYCFFKCPKCKQEVRVPKGHGKIEITCPKCQEKFVKRS